MCFVPFYVCVVLNRTFLQFCGNAFEFVCSTSYQLLENVRTSLNKNSLDCLSYTFPSERASRERGRAFPFLKYVPTNSVRGEEPLNPSVHSHLSSLSIIHLFTCLSLAPFTASPCHLSLCYQSLSHSSLCRSPYCFISCLALSHFLHPSIRRPLEHAHSRSHLEDWGNGGIVMSVYPLSISHPADGSYLVVRIFTREISLICLSSLPPSSSSHCLCPI